MNDSKPSGYIAVGDIHGCPEQLEEILNQAEMWPNHQLVFLGDYIDRGPDSDAVIKRIRNLDAVFLSGNHEEMLWDRTGFLPDGSFENLFSSVRLSKESLDWIRSELVNKFETEDYIFVHGGLNTALPLEEQTGKDYRWSWNDGDYFELTPKIVVHGHITKSIPIVVGNRIGVDTGCGSGGPLTAVVLPEQVFLKSSESSRNGLDWFLIRQQLINELGMIEKERRDFKDSVEDGKLGVLEEL